MTPERLAADKVANRIAALIQVIIVPVVLLTTSSPLTVWLLRGKFSFALGCLYGLAALASLVQPSPRWEPWTAGLGVTFWSVRSTSLVVAAVVERGIHPPWSEVAAQAALGAILALFYWRTLFRAGFFRRLDELQEGLNGEEHHGNNG